MPDVVTPPHTLVRMVTRLLVGKIFHGQSNSLQDVIQRGQTHGMKAGKIPAMAVLTSMKEGIIQTFGILGIRLPLQTQVMSQPRT